MVNWYLLWGAGEELGLEDLGLGFGGVCIRSVFSSQGREEAGRAAFACGSRSPDVAGVGGVVEVVVGPVPFGLDYRALEVEGRSLACCSPGGGSCQRVCHAAGIVPPSCPFRIRDPFGGEGASAGFCYGVVERFEGCVDRVPPIIVIPGGDRRRCAMFGSVWQARGQRHSELLHPRIFVFIFGTVARGGGWWNKCRAVKGVDRDG